MQVYNDADYPDFNDIKKELFIFQKNICESKILYQYYINNYVKNYNNGYFGTWYIFYNHIIYNLLNYLKIIHNNYMSKCKIIKSRLIIKKFIRNNIYHHLYKPDGLRFKQIKNHFDLLLTI